MRRGIADLVFDAAERFERRPALAIRRGLRTQTWSYRDVAAAAQLAASRLADAGVRPGDRVLMLAPNSPELVISMFGVWAAGGVLVPIDARTAPDAHRQCIWGRLRRPTNPESCATC